MNLTVGRTIPSPWKRIKMQYVALAGGAALAISAIVAFGATMDGGSTATSAPNAAHPAIEIPASRQQTLTVYLVDSEAEAAAIRQSEAELEALGGAVEGPGRVGGARRGRAAGGGWTPRPPPPAIRRRWARAGPPGPARPA